MPARPCSSYRAYWGVFGQRLPSVVRSIHSMEVIPGIRPTGICQRL